MTDNPRKSLPPQPVSVPVRFYGRDSLPDTAQIRALIAELRALIAEARRVEESLIEARLAAAKPRRRQMRR